MEEGNNFNLLDNSKIGSNICLYRKMRGLKALEVAEKIGLKEAAYTRYERGEGLITIKMLKQIAEVLKINPLYLITIPPDIRDNEYNLPDLILGTNSMKQQTADKQLELTLKLIEKVTTLNERLINLLKSN